MLDMRNKKNDMRGQLNEERKRREEDKHDAEEKVRISEEPYLVFKNSKIFSNSPSEHVILQMEFLNKGRGSAYEIIPDLECTAKTLDMKEFHIYRYGAVEDPIAMVGETFVICWKYKNEQKTLFRMTPEIRFKDASVGNINRHTTLTLLIDLEKQILLTMLNQNYVKINCNTNMRLNCEHLGSIINVEYMEFFGDMKIFL